jgi:hypothetical protein
MQGLCLVALTHKAGADKVADEAAVMLHHEILTEALQGLLNPFMPH